MCHKTKPNQIQLIPVRVSLEVITMRFYPTFLKAPRLGPHIKIQLGVLLRIFVGMGPYSSGEVQSVKSRVSAGRVMNSIYE